MTRTHALLALAGVATLGGFATVGQATIFDRDDRQYVRPTEGSPYSPVGLVRQGSTFSVWRSFTTGFLVDDCHVLTSQAVLGYGQAPLGQRLKFETGIGTAQEQSTNAVVVAAGGINRRETAEQRYQGGARGWILLRLEKCIGATLGHVTLKTGPFSPYEFRDLKSIGYPVDRRREHGLTMDPSCNIIAGRGPVWLNDCAAVKADGGDPIFRISTAGGKTHLDVYAMQSYAFARKRPVPLSPGNENQAVPMSLVASLIAPYLSASAHRTGDGDATQPKRGDALSDVGGSPGSPSDGRLLVTRLDDADRSPYSSGSVK